ncbi:hypothetical protein [Chitinophaga sancti]|uniref:Uncharacterized protein n=1 Tax=Chitinophaga sancti TaxID=1004 RepID=A0A1K1QZR0_9BACT|nr:hypothetical protein [Chitinophaga sancti]WQD62107.1 hypothetical protein U0033_29900 [Chitinophaga sancti]WQG92324.1 hypothetical protein SR876_12485 [Chitinophaga sancti]SFW65091.1 hypothetical protein SAMN05661012_03245 [Chitinophaga sancti]
MITQKRKLLLSNIGKIGQLITPTQALEMISTYQRQVPNGTGAVLYSKELINKLLSVPGCVGIRIVNAISEEVHTPLLVAVDRFNKNITTLVAGKGGISPYYHPWETNRSAICQTGELISTTDAVDMIKAYQELHPGTTKSNLCGRELIETLLSAPGCDGLRFFNAYADGDQKIVIIPVDALHQPILNCQLTTNAGKLFIDFPAGDSTLACPPYCPQTDLIFL